MAIIKCKYVRYRCVDGTYYHNGDICQHHDNGEYDGLCDYADDAPCRDRLGVYKNPMQCAHVQPETVMFERNAKSFELDWDYLTVGRLKVDIERIEYLSIDGEEIIKGNEE